MARYATYKDVGKKQDEDLNIIVPEITTAKEKEELISSNRVVCIDVYGEWCGPCKATAPQFAKLSKKYNNNGLCMLCKENVDLQLSKNVQGVPLFLFFKEGRFVTSITGADIPAIEKQLVELIES